MNIKINALVLVATALFFFESASAQKINNDQLKTNTQPIANSVSLLSKLEPVTFEYNPALNKLQLPSGKQFGFLNAETAIPEIVKPQSKMYTSGKNAYKSATIEKVDMESLIPVLVSSIKEQQAEIEKLKEEIRFLKNSASLQE
jgi:hypothetical protein